MQVSEVNVTPVKPSNGLVAIASVVVNNSLYLNSIAVFTKLDGSYRLLYPTKLVGGRSMSIFHPINRETSRAIEEAIFGKCSELFSEGRSDDRYRKVDTKL